MGSLIGGNIVGLATRCATVALGSTTTFHGFHGSALVVLLMAVVAAIAWSLLFAAQWLRRVPIMVHPGAETGELGPEPPAVVDLLVNRWSVTPAAVSATLVDLAARRVVGLEEVGPDRFVVRTRGTADRTHLSAYEGHVLRLVETRATGGSAPVEVLRLDAGADDPWFSTFAAAVLADAEGRSLAAAGWRRGEAIVLAVGLGVVLGIAALAFDLAHVGAARTSGRQDSGGWFAVAAVLWIAALLAGARLRTVRATPSGRDASARWLGVRAFLRRNESFAEQPPAAVAVWGRLLAYGIALGVNRAADAALAIGPDDPHHAWSRESGAWRRVRVRYPKRFGAGEPPGHVLRNGIGRLVLWGAVGLVALPVVVDLMWHVVRDVLSDARQVAIFAVFGVFLVVPMIGAVYVAARVVDGAIRTWRGACDLRRTVTREGTVVKVHGHAFAVDDGRAEELVALPAGPQTTPRIGQRVRVTYTPKLHHVEDLQVLHQGQEAMARVESLDTPHRLQLRSTFDRVDEE